MSEVQQKSLEGEPVGVEARVSKRSRPQVKIESGPYILKRNVRTIRNTREKGFAKLEEKVSVKDEHKRSIVDYSEDELDKHMMAVLEAAMHADLPGHDENWHVIQAGSQEVAGP